MAQRVLELEREVAQEMMAQEIGLARLEEVSDGTYNIARPLTIESSACFSGVYYPNSYMCKGTSRQHRLFVQDTQLAENSDVSIRDTTVTDRLERR